MLGAFYANNGVRKALLITNFDSCVKPLNCDFCGDEKALKSSPFHYDEGEPILDMCHGWCAAKNLHIEKLLKLAHPKMWVGVHVDELFNLFLNQVEQLCTGSREIEVLECDMYAKV